LSWYRHLCQLRINFVSILNQLWSNFWKKLTQKSYTKELVWCWYRVDTKWMQRLTWYNVDTHLCINFVPTVYQLPMRVDKKSTKNLRHTKLIRSWCEVAEKMTQSQTKLLTNFTSTLYQLWSNFWKKLTQKSYTTDLAQSWFRVNTNLMRRRHKLDTKLTHNFVSTFYQPYINFLWKLVKVDTKPTSYEVHMELVWSWWKDDTESDEAAYQLCINFLSAFEQTLHESWCKGGTQLSLYKVDTKLIQTWCTDDTKLIQS
jgi:hypothetical protein